MKDNYEFKGWDWTELAPVMGMEEELKQLEDVPKDYMKSEKALAENMSAKIRSYMCPMDCTEEEKQEVIGHLRAFLKKVADVTPGYSRPFYKGILAVENDDTFLQIYAWNLICMWT
jgi:hypothetical protein